MMSVMQAVRRIKTVLIDLSGTLHVEDLEIPGAVKALERLRKTGVNLKFVTNTTKESGKFLWNRLNRIGFSISHREIFSSLSAAKTLVENRKYRPLLLLDPRALEDFEGISQLDPNAVVIGLAPDKFHYQQLNEAFRLLIDGVPLIAIHKARYYKTSDGLSLGPGPFVEGLEYAAGVRAEVVGKPEKVFFTSAIEEFNCTVEDCVMIGDDVFGDVAGAQNAGMLGILVKTGKYRVKDETKIFPPPHKVAEDFPAAVDYIAECLIDKK